MKTDWACKRYILALLMLAGGNIFGQGGAAVTPVFTPTGSPTNGFPLFGAGGSAYGWRAMTSGDVTTALGFTPISAPVSLNSQVTGYLPVSINAQASSSYAIAASDAGKLVVFTNNNASGVTLPQATGSFGAGFVATLSSTGIFGATVTPTTSLVCGSTTLHVLRNAFTTIISDGTNYQCLSGPGVDSGGNVTGLIITGTGFANNTTGTYNWSNRSNILSPADGVILFRNNAANNFSALDLGGTTSGFASISVTNQTNPIIKFLDAAGGATENLQLGSQAASSGLAVLCVDTSGNIAKGTLATCTGS